MSGAENEILSSINQKVLSGYKYIFDNYYAALCNYSCSFSIQKTVAEDIVQDVILRLWKSDSRFSSFKALASYLYKSVKNASLNSIRNNSKMTDSDLALKVWFFIISPYQESLN